jgi:predicted unusual protein kinase regulating ubiquinone biosynthesis (AarF/ABC1/UbiB family)
VLFGAGRQYVDTVLQGRQPDRLPTLLRKTFEKLGATYIKLGQFIASSPSLFPEEYVLEFQKCLDKTDPVQFEKIKDTIAAELGRPVEEVCF